MKIFVSKRQYAQKSTLSQKNKMKQINYEKRQNDAVEHVKRINLNSQQISLENLDLKL